jgi:hypothetical protein
MEENMSSIFEHHRTLINGAGKCSVPMWMMGCPAGFCDAEAYSERPEPPHYYRDGRTGQRKRSDCLYDGYVPALACPAHGGKTKEEALNLCDYCQKHIAECRSNPKFGTGKGRDNIYECDVFEPRKTE